MHMKTSTDQQGRIQAVEAEQAVIGALLRHNHGVDHIDGLLPAHFAREDHRMIYVEILRQIQTGHGCDVVSVGAALPQLEDGMAYLNDIAQSVPSAANIGRYAKIVRDHALRRATLATIYELMDVVRNPGPRSADDVLDYAQAALGGLAVTRTVQEPAKASAAMVPHLSTMDDRVEGKRTGILTGFTDLDDLFNGGPNEGALVILGARPSMGKTALALNIATHVAASAPVLVLSQEMQNGDLLDRELAMLGRIPLGTIIKGNLSPMQWDAFTAANAKLAGLELYLDDQPALTLLDVRCKARMVKRKFGLKLLVVDYLQLMSGDGDPRKNRNQQIEEISRGLKALAKELGIVVLALSQLSRNGANKSRPQLSDLRDSGAIEQDADIVIFIHREEVDNPQTHLKGFADVFVAKNRQGAVDDVLLGYDGQYTLFANNTRPRPTEARQQTYRRGLAASL